MGCAASRLQDEEAVKICRDRRDFIKQALEQRNNFASSHIAYIESLKRVSMALQRFVAGDDHLELIFDPFISPVKQQKPEVLGLPYSSYEKRAIHVAKYLRSGPNPSVSVEERPRLVETVRVESHYPMGRYSGIDHLQSSSYCPPPPYDRPNYPPPPVQEPVKNSSYYMPYDQTSYAPPSSQEPVRTSYHTPYDKPSYPSPSPQEPARASYYASYDRTSFPPPSPQEPTRASYYASYDRPNYPPPSPQEPTRTSYYASYDRPNYPPPSPQDQEPSQWDFLWNPLSSLDNYAYPCPPSSYDNVDTDDELARLQRVREEEGIPELEEEDDECQEHVQMHKKEENEEHGDENDAEDEDEGGDEDEECEYSDDRCVASNESACPVKNTKQETKAFDSKGVQCTAAPEPRRTVELEIKAHKKELMRNKVANAEETPGFTVYLNRRPASLVEAMKDIDSQFLGICDDAREVTVLLEASRAQYSTSNDLSGTSFMNQN
jgi:hypothetical protein